MLTVWWSLLLHGGGRVGGGSDMVLVLVCVCVVI